MSTTIALNPTLRTYILGGEAGSMLLFAAVVTGFVLYNWRGLFVPRHARSHRLVGIAYFSLLVVGGVDASKGIAGMGTSLGFSYDLVLGIFGVLIAVTAAIDFGPGHDEKRFVRNKASGTLEEEATVTKAEMWEHSFYQLLLLMQILYIHTIGAISSEDSRATLRFTEDEALALRLCALAVVTAPWYFRYLVPVNSFSKNYSDEERAWTLIGVMYQSGQ